MKRLIYIIGVIGLIFVNGCSYKVNGLKNQTGDEIKIGVIETKATKYESYIHWYDKGLNKISEQKLKYAMLGSPFHNPVYLGDEIFLIPQGLGNRKDSKKIISINKRDFKIREYSFNNIALNDLAVNEDYIYTINTLNGNTHISKLNRESQQLEEIIIEKEYVSGIVAVADKLYAFSFNMETSSPKFYMYVYNKELELLDKKDFTQFGTGQYKFLIDENYLYANVMATKEDEAGTIILKISVDTNEVEGIDINEEFPNDILQYKGKLIITNHDLVMYEGNKITILDKLTKEIETIELDRKTEFAGIIDNLLIIGNQENIALYNMDKKLELIRELSMEKDDESYISNIIVLD